jgi:hypothetical protein
MEWISVNDRLPELKDKGFGFYFCLVSDGVGVYNSKYINQRMVA